MSNEKDEKDIDLFEEVKENSKSAAEIVEKAVNVQEALEKKTHTEMGMVEQFEVHKTLSTDAVDLGVMATAVVAAVVVNKASQYIDEKSEKITEIKDDISEKVAQVKETIKDKFTEKDIAKEWEKDIQIKEQAINEKFDKEIKETEKRLEKQLDYIEEKYDDNIEKKKKQNELKTTIEKVHADIEKDRNTELKQQEERKDNLEKIEVATKGMEENERQRIIQQQRELERKLELERKK